MAKPLRLEHAGALYHITARGDQREDIFFENDDRSEFLSILREVCRRFNWVVHAYCQMTNHYHLLFETVDGNLQDEVSGLTVQHCGRDRNAARACLLGHAGLSSRPASDRSRPRTAYRLHNRG